MTIPEEDTEAGQTGKYCLVAIGRLQVCGDTNNLNTLIKWKEWLCLCVFMYSIWTEHLSEFSGPQVYKIKHLAVASAIRNV